MEGRGAGQGALARRWRDSYLTTLTARHVGEVHAAGTHCVLLLGESLNPDGLTEVGPSVVEALRREEVIPRAGVHTARLGSIFCLLSFTKMEREQSISGDEASGPQAADRQLWWDQVGGALLVPGEADIEGDGLTGERIHSPNGG